MKTSTLIAGAALSLIAGFATAQPVGENPPTTTILCLDVAGRTQAATCKVPASRLDPTEDICLCGGASERVVAPICPPGVNPPSETAAFEHARHKAIKNGSLVGATWQGQPMCVAPRPGYPRPR
jgi:hypothetical protein